MASLYATWGDGATEKVTLNGLLSVLSTHAAEKETHVDLYTDSTNGIYFSIAPAADAAVRGSRLYLPPLLHHGNRRFTVQKGDKVSAVEANITSTAALISMLDTDLLELWSADALSSLTLVTTDHVSAWTGLKNSTVLGQATDARRPQYRPTGWNSLKPDVYFEGTVLRNLTLTTLTNIPKGTTPFEIWMVVDQPDVAGTKILIQWPSTTAGKRATISYFKDPQNLHRLIVTGPASTSTNADATVADGLFGKHVVRGRWEALRVLAGLDSTAAEVTKMTAVAAALNTDSTGTLALGSQSSNGGFWGGSIRFIAMVKPLSDAKGRGMYNWAKDNS